MFEQNKNLTLEVFGKSAGKNNKCIILIATNAYDISINNLDVKLVIQQDISLLFDFIIQQMRRIKKKIRVSAFILFTLKQTRIKNLDKIEKKRNDITFTLANIQISNSNWLKALSKTSFWSQIVNIKNKLNDLEFVVKSEIDFKLNKKVEFFSKILVSNIKSI